MAEQAKAKRRATDELKKQNEAEPYKLKTAKGYFWTFGNGELVAYVYSSSRSDLPLRYLCTERALKYRQSIPPCGVEIPGGSSIE
jgi:hypothetical protein